MARMILAWALRWATACAARDSAMCAGMMMSVICPHGGGDGGGGDSPTDSAGKLERRMIGVGMDGW